VGGAAGGRQPIGVCCGRSAEVTRVKTDVADYVKGQWSAEVRSKLTTESLPTSYPLMKDTVVTKFYLIFPNSLTSSSAVDRQPGHKK